VFYAQLDIPITLTTGIEKDVEWPLLKHEGDLPPMFMCIFSRYKDVLANLEYRDFVFSSWEGVRNQKEERISLAGKEDIELIQNYFKENKISCYDSN
jgi:hypothetical protein